MLRFPNHGVFNYSQNKNLIDLFYPPKKDKLKTFVISLDRRPERKEVFDQNNQKYLTHGYEYFSAVDGKSLDYETLKSMGYDTFKDWKDPITKNNITTGEVATLLSHLHIWEKCIELNEPILILEDDAIITENFSYDEIFSLLIKGIDMVYLGWLEMDESEKIDDKFSIPSYPYWNLAYVVTPDACRILVNDFIKQNIIPVDEYCPLVKNKIRTIAYNNNVVYPRDKDDAISDIDPKNRYDFFLDFDTHVVTVGTDESKCQKLYDSAEHHGVNLVNLGKGKQWIGGDMTGPGGGQKTNLLFDYIQDLPDHDVVLFCDAYDVFFGDTTEEVVRRFIEMGTRYDVLFSAEKYCWPDENLASEFTHKNPQLNDGYYDTPFKYLNSGLFIGRVGELKKMIPNKINPMDDDQLYYQKKYLSGEQNIGIDFECYIFQTNDDDVRFDGKNRQLYNPTTRSFNCIYHGNGGDSAKKQLDRLYNKFYGTDIITYIPSFQYEKINDDMIVVDFLSPEMCNSLIELADNHGKWESLSYDNFPAQEIRIKELDLWESMEYHWKRYIDPIVEEFWTPTQMYGLRDAFILRYSLETQKRLNLHNDASLVTGSVKLNDNYEGADLYFPRQDVSNKDIDVGKCILFPGQLSHGHTSRDLISGVKYSLTIWTSRYDNDLI